MFLGWYDPDKKKSAREKLAAALERYTRKWGHPATVALVNAADAIGLDETDGIEVRVVAYVAPNTFYVGIDEEQAETQRAA